jgi:hypothetical protein
MCVGIEGLLLCLCVDYFYYRVVGRGVCGLGSDCIFGELYGMLAGRDCCTKNRLLLGCLSTFMLQFFINQFC